ncbi:hypothetical protein BCY89_16050 [Sphingobacterium siyangense]|uniref:Uncharacterized protein n=1 Tax=Sphingobacterium siyangense TaxID=459529 RepID=A0A420FFQ5_9SPHI|nr:DUF6266 family protein [Sphingobacterium siyangense]QRY56098.1 hypothetical protein JVX97_18995 [Sphingobacterium siyangense]RKF31686.1 hypothetical protein BCY89_16050 [Sphingobacterium siyangense]
MAIIKNGVNGTVSGKAGSVVFVSTNTGNYVRSLPSVKKREPTPEQLLSRKRFKIVRSHISQLKPIINMGYKAYSYPKRAYDVAMSYNLNEALIRKEDGFVVDWPKFMIAKGSPNPITSYTLDFDQENQVLQVTWEFDAYLEEKFDTGSYDSFLILYNAADNGGEYPLVTNELKSSLMSGKQKVEIPKHRKEATYEVYIFFIESYGGGNTDSLHLGTLKV